MQYLFTPDVIVEDAAKKSTLLSFMAPLAYSLMRNLDMRNTFTNISGQTGVCME